MPPPLRHNEELLARPSQFVEEIFDAEQRIAKVRQKCGSDTPSMFRLLGFLPGRMP